MYIPSAFHEQDLEWLRGFLHEHPFAMLVSIVDEIPFATHLPLLLETRGDMDVLIGHVPRANAHTQAFGADVESMAVFTGPHGYVSPRWLNDGAVPTWNYAAVHAYGTARLVDDEGEARDLLARQVAAFEGDQWTLDDLGADKAAAMIGALAVFEMPVDLWRGQVKASQNKTPGEQDRVQAELEAAGTGDDQAHEMAALMKERRGK